MNYLHKILALVRRTVADARDDSQRNFQPKILTSATSVVEPGDYCLGRDIEGSLDIRASKVTLDLHGHRVIGPFDKSATGVGISIANGLTDVTIRGGSILGHHYGVRADAVTGLLIDGICFSKQNFRGVRADGADITIRNCRIQDIGGSQVYSDAYVMGIEVNGQGTRIDGNIIREFYPTDSGEGVGILLGYNSPRSTIERNLIGNFRLPATGRTFGIWTSEEGTAIRDNVIMLVSYGVEGHGAAGNILIDVPCGSYKGLPAQDRYVSTGQSIACPDDYLAASENFDARDRNKVFRMAQVHHRAGIPILSCAYFLLAAQAGSSEAADEAQRQQAAGSITSDEMEQAQLMAAMFLKHHERIGRIRKKAET